MKPPAAISATRLLALMCLPVSHAPLAGANSKETQMPYNGLGRVAISVLRGIRHR